VPIREDQRQRRVMTLSQEAVQTGKGTGESAQDGGHVGQRQLGTDPQARGDVSWRLAEEVPVWCAVAFGSFGIRGIASTL